MKYVLDSSVALKWVPPEPDSPKARQLRDDYVNQIHELLTPDVFSLEIAHALTRAERQGRIVVSHAAIFWADILTTSPRLEPSGLLIPRAIQISSAARIGVDPFIIELAAVP
jgi:predicted nucleic acid-binding protein